MARALLARVAPLLERAIEAGCVARPPPVEEDDVEEDEGDTWE